jgi:hypothetical protein
MLGKLNSKNCMQIPGGIKFVEGDAEGPEDF